MQTPSEVREMQIKGIQQVMDIYDWRYVDPQGRETQEWDLLLWAGKVITINAPQEAAEAIAKASEAAGDGALFMIASAGAWDTD